MNDTDAYRVLALVELAGRFPEPLTVAQIARRRGVPTRFLARLLGELARDGLVTTARGPRGGVRLAARPETIRLTSLVRPEPFPEARGAAVSWLANRLARARDGALEKLTLVDLLQVERDVNATANFEI